MERKDKVEVWKLAGVLLCLMLFTFILMGAPSFYPTLFLYCHFPPCWFQLLFYSLFIFLFNEATREQQQHC